MYLCGEIKNRLKWDLRAATVFRIAHFSLFSLQTQILKYNK